MISYRRLLLFRLICLSILFVLLISQSACGGKSSLSTSTLAIDPVDGGTSPIVVEPGAQRGIKVSDPEGQSVAFVWDPTGGEILEEKCNSDKSVCFYLAPAEPGEQVVTVKGLDRKEREVARGEVVVIVPTPIPTFTPTPTPTDTPTSTPTNTPTAMPTSTDTPTPSNTPTPTPTPISTKTPTKTPKPMDTPSTTEEPTVTITITEPKKEVECSEGTACIFMIKGTSTGIAPNSTYKIAPFVNPSPGDPNQWFPQLDRPLGSDISEDGTWQAEAQIGTDEGVDPGHRFEIVALVMDAKAEISLDFQPLPELIAQSNIVTLVTIAKPDEGECPFISPFRTPIEGPSVDVEASITSIENCADTLPTASPIPLRGTYSGDMTNKELWVLVYPPNILYYPQSIDACRELSAQFANGQWAETIRLGREGTPEAFHIVVVVTEIGSPASQAFHNYLRVGCDTTKYNGFTLLPPGVTELDSIVVHTR